MAAALVGCGRDSHEGSVTTTERRVSRAPGHVDGRAPADRSHDASRHKRSPTSSPRILSAADRRSFAKLAASLPGSEGVAVSAIGRGRRVERLGSLRGGVAWSTIKVPIALAAVHAGVGRSADVAAAITASDNTAATALWGELGGGRRAAGAAEAQLRAAGDRNTRLEHRTLRPGFTPFGQTAWALTDQVRFMAAMPCLADAARILALMGHVVASQRFGLGSAEVPTRFKGGWGPGRRPGVDGGYLDRQMGIVTVRGKLVAVAIASLPADGRDATGRRSLTAMARWLVDHADVVGLPTRRGC